MQDLWKCIQNDDITPIFEKVGKTIKKKHFVKTMRFNWFKLIRNEKIKIIEMLLFVDDSFENHLDETGRNFYGIALELGLMKCVQWFSIHQRMWKIVHDYKIQTMWDIILQFHSYDSLFFQHCIVLTKFANQLPNQLNEITMMLYNTLDENEQNSYVVSMLKKSYDPSIIDYIPKKFNWDIFQVLVERSENHDILSKMSSLHWNIINVKNLLNTYNKVKHEFGMFQTRMMLAGLRCSEIQFVKTIINVDTSSTIKAAWTNIAAVEKNFIIFQLLFQQSIEYDDILLSYCLRQDLEQFVELIITHPKFNIQPNNTKFIKAAFAWNNLKMIRHIDLSNVLIQDVMEFCPHPTILKQLKISEESYDECIFQFIRAGYLGGVQFIYHLAKYETIIYDFFIFAAKYGRLEIMKWFQQLSGINFSPHEYVPISSYKNVPNPFSRLNALQTAIKSRQFETCKYLLQFPLTNVDDLMTFLPDLLTNGHTKLACLLLGQGVLIIQDLEKYLQHNLPCLEESVEQRLYNILKPFQILQNNILPMITSYLTNIDDIKLWLSI